MKNKILVTVFVPLEERCFDVFIPVNKRIGTVIRLLNKAIYELSDQSYPLESASTLCNKRTGQNYDWNLIVKNTDLKNGEEVILL